MQWKCLPIPHDTQGKPAIHYTTVYKVFAKWAGDGSLWQAFVASVRHLAVEKQLDISVLHGDGTNTVAKKGGDGIGYSGHKHEKGEKVIAMTDNNGYVLAPLPVAPVNETDMVLLPKGLTALKQVAKEVGLDLRGAYVSTMTSTHLSMRPSRLSPMKVLVIPGVPNRQSASSASD